MSLVSSPKTGDEKETFYESWVAWKMGKSCAQFEVSLKVKLKTMYVFSIK